MSKIRVGFATNFNIVNSNVGIATTNPRAKLHVAGVIKGDFDISGVTTFTSYGGFIPQKQSVATIPIVGFNTIGVGAFIQPNESETGYTRLQGEFNTLSEDIIVEEGRIFEIATDRVIGITTLGTQSINIPSPSIVSQGTLESITVGSHFSVPNSGISSRPQDPREGMVRFNDDLNTLEFYNGVEWRQFTVTGASGRGVFGGGLSESVAYSDSIISYININTTGNAIYFGDLAITRRWNSAFSSSTRGLFGGGQNVPGVDTNSLEYITIASTGNSQDFGDLTVTTFGRSSFSSSTRGITAGGSFSNVIDYVEINTLGNALDFGDLLNSVTYTGTCSSPTRGIFGGGQTSSSPTAISNQVQFVTISSKGNAIYFGDLSAARAASASVSSPTRGLFSGGGIPVTYLNTIDFITISSTGNAQDFGDLTISRWGLGSSSTNIRGVFGGGYNVPAFASQNVMDYITIASTGNAQDFGDLTKRNFVFAGCSDSHGGLGGF